MNFEVVRKIIKKDFFWKIVLNFFLILKFCVSSRNYQNFKFLVFLKKLEFRKCFSNNCIYIFLKFLEIRVFLKTKELNVNK